MRPGTKTNRADSGIVLERSGEGIVQIRLNRPERLNALGMDMVEALQAAIADAFADRRADDKRLVYRGLEMTLADGLAQEGLALREILASPDYAEGLEAFAEKRQPRFGGGTIT